MIRLKDARALALVAREDTSVGLEAREQLADVVDQLADALDGFLGAGSASTKVQWATRMRNAAGQEDDTDPTDEKLAKRRFESYPFHVALLARAVTTIERPWVEIAAKAVDDA